MPRVPFTPVEDGFAFENSLVNHVIRVPSLGMDITTGGRADPRHTPPAIHVIRGGGRMKAFRTMWDVHSLVHLDEGERLANDRLPTVSTGPSVSSGRARRQP